MKLAGVVILYHPDDSVIMNISTYIEELDVLYVLDNSEIPAEAIASKIKEFPNAHYVAFRDNMGISYALNYALKQCTELSFLIIIFACFGIMWCRGVPALSGGNWCSVPVRSRLGLFMMNGWRCQR